MTKVHKILIVDDDPNEITITKRVLSKTGFEITAEAAMHGEAAFEILRNQNELPSVMFLDLKMPGMSGIDVLRRVRADSSMKNIKVIVMTNSLLETDKDASYAAGADGFLHKALNIYQFEKDITSVLKRWLKE